MRLVKSIAVSIAALGATAFISCKDVERAAEHDKTGQVEQEQKEEIATGPQEEGELEEPTAGVDETTTGTSAAPQDDQETTTPEEPIEDTPPMDRPGGQP